MTTLESWEACKVHSHRIVTMFWSIHITVRKHRFYWSNNTRSRPDMQSTHINFWLPHIHKDFSKPKQRIRQNSSKKTRFNLSSIREPLKAWDGFLTRFAKCENTTLLEHPLGANFFSLLAACGMGKLGRVSHRQKFWFGGLLEKYNCENRYLNTIAHWTFTWMSPMQSEGDCTAWLYDNSDQRRIRTENQIRTKDKFGPNFWNSAQIISLINLIT